MKKLKGLYKGNDLSNADYHAETEHLSSSNLKTLLKDVEKFHNEKILGNVQIKKLNAFDEGSLVHGMILEPHLVDEEFVMFDGFRKSGKVWEAFKQAEKSGKNRTILSKPQWLRCQKWVEAFKQNKTAVEIVKSSQTELSLFGNMQDVPIKVRADIIDVEAGIIADIKTTSYPTDIDSFRYTVQDFDYGLSAALYTGMFEQYYGKSFQFLWIVIGKKEFTCDIYKMSDKTRSAGQRKIDKALKLFKKCKKTGMWKNEVDILAKKCYTDYEIKEI